MLKLEGVDYYALIASLRYVIERMIYCVIYSPNRPGELLLLNVVLMFSLNESVVRGLPSQWELPFFVTGKNKGNVYISRAESTALLQ